MCFESGQGRLQVRRHLREIASVAGECNPLQARVDLELDLAQLLASGHGAVEEMIVDELIPLIDTSYPAKAEAKARAVAGFSMGGAGGPMPAAGPGLAVETDA